MEIIISLTLSIITILVIQWVYDYSIKKIKNDIDDKKLDKLTDKFPENKEICKSILKKLNNEKVNVKENEEENNKTSLYVALTNTIFIANIKDTYTRVQTIAHECIHSIQNRRILLFNFYFSNLYIMYFLSIAVLTLTRVITNYNLYLIILLILSFIYFAVRSYLETDAMTKARYVAEDYLRENNICEEKEIEVLVNKYDEINKIGIPAYNFVLFRKCMIKIIIYLIISLIMLYIG